ncbi:hypothetical protein [Streptomyces sp. NRRL S-1448]|uniref:hypothetical protein n=1 Tax=Streptomyces sp. NRRL S-1448 TaxID=1463883 RepID=UPI0004BF64DE|nr:hypothetical protein [Streptomyces sp. NRRL S-1448]
MPESWLKAGAQTTPNPIRVSTVAVTEYGRLDLYLGTSKPSNVAWPIQCRRFRIRIPTGQQGDRLTAVGAFISASATPTAGRDWRVARNTTDPNSTVIDVIPDSEYATFDGTWRLGITLSGIEINTSPGTANITIEEETRKPNEASFTTREGTVRVPKELDDAQTFYFRSLRPANTVIARGTKVQLNWEGSSNATYTVYYRDKSGTDRARVLTNPGGTWDSQALHGDTFTDATNFTVKASLGGRDLYQTTHVRVERPDISVNKIHTSDRITAAGIQGPSNDDPLQVHGKMGLMVHSRLDVGSYGGASTFHAPVETKGTLTTTGALNADSDVTINTAKTLTVTKLAGHGNNAITVSSEIDQSTATGKAIKTGSGGLTANGEITVKADKKLKTNTITFTSGNEVKVEADLAVHESWVLKTNYLERKANKPIEIRHDALFKAGVTLEGSFDAIGAMSLLCTFERPTSGEQHPFKYFAAPATSGLVVGVLDSYDVGGNGSIKVFGRLTDSNWPELGTAWWEHRGSATLVAAVKKGQRFVVKWYRDAKSGRQQCRFYWIPFGKANAPTPTAVSQDETPLEASERSVLE